MNGPHPSRPAVLTIGEVALDEVVVEGSGRTWRQLGGGALYSAVGALIWGGRPSVSAVLGTDVMADLSDLANAGIDLDLLTRVDRPGIGLWLLYERSGRRQQVPKLDAAEMLTLDRERDLPVTWDRFLGVHIAPQSTEGQLRALQAARGNGRVVTVGCMVEPFIDLAPYRDGSLLQGVSAFLASQDEAASIWGRTEPSNIGERLDRLAGLKTLVITRGARGADVIREGEVINVPAINVVECDSTGAGDAFAGGFLVGFLEHGDPIQAARYGAVSASFVVETRGLLEAINSINPAEATRRLSQLEQRRLEGT